MTEATLLTITIYFLCPKPLFTNGSLLWLLAQLSRLFQLATDEAKVTGVIFIIGSRVLMTQRSFISINPFSPHNTPVRSLEQAWLLPLYEKINRFIKAKWLVWGYIINRVKNLTLSFLTLAFFPLSHTASTWMCFFVNNGMSMTFISLLIIPAFRTPWLLGWDHDPPICKWITGKIIREGNN